MKHTTACRRMSSLYILFVSRYPISPSMGSVLYERGCAIARSPARSARREVAVAGCRKVAGAACREVARAACRDVLAMSSTAEPNHCIMSEAALSALKGAADESCGGKQLKILPECSLFPPEGLSLFYIKRRETPSIHRGESVSPLYREERETPSF